MSNYKLNTVHFRLEDKEFSIFCTVKHQPKLRKKNIKYLPVEIQNKFMNHEGSIYYTFDKKEGKEWKKVICIGMTYLEFFFFFSPSLLL